jgi:hypothetical protein
MRRSPTARRQLLVAVGLTPVLALALTASASADRGRYLTRSFTETASSGLAVTGPLADRRAVSRARVVVPDEWRRLSAKPGQLRFETPGGSCRYRVTFTVDSGLAAPRDPAQRVGELLPGPGARYLLDSGQRGRAAFRVIREQSTGRVRLRGLRAGVLTRRADIVPAGQVAWSEIGASAVSRPGDECHAGTWRERLGPQIGDSLATVRTTLRFAAAP